jgi:guanidinobutyrase / D-arginase
MIQPGPMRAPWAALAAVLDIAAAVDLVGVDLAEVAPASDHAELTTIAAANVVYEPPGLPAPRRSG